MRILVVEDDSRMARLFGRALRGAGYAVDLVSNGEEAVEYMDVGAYDLVVLDVLLPGIDGFAVCQQLRRVHRNVPILIVSARAETVNRVRGLETGADDYLPKPFALEEFLARVRALLRRRELPQQAILSVGPIRLDRGRHLAQVGRRMIELTAKEYSLLEYLLLNRGRVVTRSQIADHVWDDEYDLTSNVVDVYIGRLRQKLDPGSDRDESFLTTLRNVGYLVRDSAKRGEWDRS